MWFTENPWPPIFLCVGLAGLCAAAWNATRRGVALGVAIALLVLSVAIFFAERSIVTDSERVENAVRQIAAAYERRDLDGTLALVSGDAPDIQALVRSTMAAYEVRDLRITDLSVRLNNAGSEAVSHFRANATVASRGGGFGPVHQPTRWEFTWQREASGWKLAAVQPLEIVTGDPDERLERHLGRGR